MAEQNGEPMDSGVDLMTLVDEDGVEHQFEVADSAELDGKNYMALIPVFENPSEMLDDPGELVILRVMEEDGEEFLEIIEDEAEFDKVGDFFMDRLSETFDFTDEEE
jgi:uncharacterized protein YrzB (UPF0473 family)